MGPELELCDFVTATSTLGRQIETFLDHVARLDELPDACTLVDCLIAPGVP